ncbi:MAG: hypothetical protein AAGH65_00995 [Pseudomonadota bacterium]
MKGLLIGALLITLPVAAQDPILRTEINAIEAMPGQALSLRVTVLVPTFMPRAPEWPSFEAPNLLVRVAATGPVSERIDGQTWSGVSRRFQITPMVPGEVRIPTQPLKITWADPNNNQPRGQTLQTEPLMITGTVPRGAERLDPFIAADALSLEQFIEGGPDTLTPGAAFTRTVVATIEGVPPMFIPSLLPDAEVDGLRAYADAPVVEASNQRGRDTGTRTERISYMAEHGGSGILPAIQIDWFNRNSEQIETARLAEIDVRIEGPASPVDTISALDWRQIAWLLITLIIALCILIALGRRILPAVKTAWSSHRASVHASEGFAFSALMHAVHAHDQTAVRPALDRWAERLNGDDPRLNPELMSALAQLGHAQFGRSPNRSSDEAWTALAEHLIQARRSSRSRSRLPELPKLNPEV